MRKLVLVLPVLCAALLSGTASAQNCRFYFAAQHDWGNNRGFYLDVEGCELGTLRFILGVADGQQWRYIAHVPPFEPGRQYEGRAEITPTGARLYVDDELVGEQEGGFAPHDGGFQVNITYPWSADIGDYLIVQESVAVTVERGGEEVAKIERRFDEEAARPIPLQVFERGAPTLLDVSPEPGDTLTITTTFRTEASDLQEMSPIIDRYGQNRYADWPEKVRSDDELRADIEREARLLAEMPPPRGYDRYGGYERAGWKEGPTGFFSVTKRDGYWWLITPEGNPCFYVGVCAGPTTTWPNTPVTGREFMFEWLPAKDEDPWRAGWSANAWGVEGVESFCFHTSNLMRKYGDKGWNERAVEQHVRRVQAFGFSGGGKWGSGPGLVDVPVIGRGETPILVEHPDVFDPDACAKFRAEIERQIAPRRDDPLVLGWSLGNEFGEIIKRPEIESILGMGAGVPAKRALVDHVVERRYGGSVERAAAAWEVEAKTAEDLRAAELTVLREDIEAARRHYQDRYYEFIYRTVKEIDPNHLYLGNWIVPTWWENESDWSLIARHCDVIGYDRYHRQYDDDLLARLQRETDKPTLCGEFSMPAWYGGLRGFGRFHTNAEIDAESGELYQGWVRGAAADPHCVGLLWFHYRDQPITGRGPGSGPAPYHGEHFAFGLITVTDRVKWDMVSRMREVNLQAAELRLQAAAQADDR